MKQAQRETKPKDTRREKILSDTPVNPSYSIQYVWMWLPTCILDLQKFLCEHKYIDQFLLFKVTYTVGLSSSRYSFMEN